MTPPPSDPATRTTPALSSVFSCLYRSRQPLTKQEVARETGLSLPTVYQALSSLRELGLLAEGGERQSTGGRRASTFSVNAGGVGAVGVSVTGSQVRVLGCDLRGEIVDGVGGELPLEGPLTTPELARTLQGVAEDAVSDMGSLGLRAVGVGVAVPSAIDPATGRLLNTRVLKISDPGPTAGDLVSGIALPADVFNDASCGGFSEVFPTHSGRSIAYVSLERGVGGAIIIGGVPYEGEGGASAEFGHICVEPGGKPCTCGRRGCLEAYCSSACLSDELGCTLDEFFSRFDSGDPEAVARFVDYAEHLVRGIQVIRTIFDCDVVLGGFMAPRLSFYFDFIVRRAEQLDFLRADASFLRYARHPLHGAPLGAAQKMVQRYIERL